MAYLDKAMFGNPNCHTFGLSNGQMKGYAALNNAGWYNGYGEKLGYGDLAISNLHDIQRELSEGECFAALSERASSWDMPKTLDCLEPGIQYIKDNAAWFVTPSNIFYIDPSRSETDSEFDSRSSCWYLTGPRSEILLHVAPYFEEKTPDTIVIEEEHLGLKTKTITDNITGETAMYAYGTRTELFNAAKRNAANSLFMEEMSCLAKYIPISKQEIANLDYLCNNRGQAANSLIKLIIGKHLDKWVEDIVHSKGIVSIAEYDGCIVDSDSIPILPKGYRAFRVY